MVGIYILLVLLSTRLSEGSFYISSEKSSWHEQSRNCTPAKLNVIGADTGYKLSENTVVDIPHGENVWVGYYQVTRVFEYIGCVSISELFNNEERSYIAIKGDPGHCYPGCGINTIIGVTKTRCYCLWSEFNAIKQTEVECSDICDTPSVACGHDDVVEKNTYLSIYKMNTDVTASTIHQVTVNSNCLSMTSNRRKTFVWHDCNFALQVMCTYGDSVKEFDQNSGELTWFLAANTCFRNKVLPTNFSNSKDVKSDGSFSSLWTGMFKTNVVYRYDAKIQEKREYDPVSFGYLTRDIYGSVKLLFTRTDREARSNKRAICYDETDGTIDKLHDTSNVESPSSDTLIGICVSLAVLLVAMTVASLYIWRMRYHASIETNFLTPINTPTNFRNRESVPADDRTDVQYDDGQHYYTQPAELVDQNDQGDLASQHYYTQPAELVDQNVQSDLASQHYYTQPAELVDQNDKTAQQREGGTSEMCQSIEIRGRSAERFDITPVTSTGVYESLQDRTTEAHKYELLKM